METVACDYCGTAESVQVAQQTDKLHHTSDRLFTIVRCTSCGLQYTNPRPDRSDIGNYYAESYAFHAKPSKLRSFLASAARLCANLPLAGFLDIFPPLSRRLIPYLQPGIADPVLAYYKQGGKGTFLDIGCGAGVSAHFWGTSGSLQAYRRLTDVAGIEVAAAAREKLTASGIEAWDSLDAVPESRRFGVIRMNWSLEHVHSPDRYFAFLRNHLISGGRAIIAVPNYDGLIYRLAPDCVELPIHLYHFRPVDLHNYAARHGLRIAHLQTFSYPQMFSAAAQAGMLPEQFADFASLRQAQVFQSMLDKFDQAGWGNDMIAILAPDQAA